MEPNDLHILRPMKFERSSCKKALTQMTIQMYIDLFRSSLYSLRYYSAAAAFASARPKEILSPRAADERRLQHHRGNKKRQTDRAALAVINLPYNVARDDHRAFYHILYTLGACIIWWVANPRPDPTCIHF
jgi:hypothetical protein